MPKLGIAGFDGVVPRTSPAMLADNQAQQADNVKLYAGELRYWRGAKLDFVPANPGCISIYKMINAAGSSRWLSWNTVVDVAPSPSSDLTDIRLYYTGDGTPKKTNWTLAGTGSGPFPGDYQEMGVPAPTTPPAVTAVAGSAQATDTRFYVYTFVNTFGSLKEESAPSPPSASITINANQAVQVNGFQAAPSGKYNITAIRIYRTVTGSTGGNYAFVAEIPISQTSYTDDLKATQLGSALPTLGWTPPPSNLQGIVPMANGILAGFAGNTVYFCEPYFPHAWPLKYAINVPYNIVGLGAIGSMLVVMTDMNPFVIQGVAPGAMTSEKLPLPEPCVSKRSIAVDEQGVIYASPNGLVSIGPNGAGVVTQRLFRRDEWQATAPTTLVGAVFEGRYFGFFQSPTLGNRCMVLSRDDIPALCYFDAPALAAHVDTRNAKLYYLKIGDASIYEADADEQNPFVYQWKSKRFLLPQAISFSVLKVDADYGAQQNIANYNAQVAAIIAANQAKWAGDLKGALNKTPLNTYSVNGSILINLPVLASARSVQVFIYGDGKLVAQKSLTSLDPVRLPPFKAREFEILITGNTPVRSVLAATTIEDLKT